MARKRKRTRAAPAAATPNLKAAPASDSPTMGTRCSESTTTTTTGGNSSSRPGTSAKKRLLETKVVENGAAPGVVAHLEVQPRENDEENLNMLGIPWALPPEQEPLAWATAADDDDDDDDDDNDDEDIQEDENELNSTGRRAPSSLSASSALASDPDNRWKHCLLYTSPSPRD